MVSVIVPVYNTAPFLERCISSIQDNTYTDLEIICVNDGSTDNSQDVLQKLAEKDRRIKVINQLNGGVSSARNIGLETATGEYIAFVDSDDWIHKAFFSVLLEEAEKHSARVVACRYTQVGDDYAVDKTRLPNGDQKNSRVCDVTYNTLNHVSSCKLFRRDCLEGIRFPEGIHVGEDHIFMSIVTHNNLGEKAVDIDLPLYFYYMREDSLTHTRDGEEFRAVSNWYLSHVADFIDRAVPVMSAMKAALAYRSERGSSKETRQLLTRCVQNMWNIEHLSIFSKVLYTVLALSSFAYQAGVKLVGILTN